MVEFRIPYKVTGNEGLNKLYAGGHWAIRKKKADKWHNLVHESLVNQVPRRIFDCPVIIDIAYNSKLDIDNHGYLSKLIVDGMKGYLIHEDSRKYVQGLIQRFHDEGEQIIIRVMEVE
ncbi:MAG: hypothetical protein LC100_06310 [Chitinophagales bacterium]|nr:hypothetical protein [Chitinophagales bacterium]